MSAPEDPFIINPDTGLEYTDAELEILKQTKAEKARWIKDKLKKKYEDPLLRARAQELRELYCDIWYALAVLEDQIIKLKTKVLK